MKENKYGFAEDDDGIVSERTGTRDLWIEKWHRKLGLNGPCTDIDKLVIEYDYAIPKALIEYKQYNCKMPKSCAKQLLAIQLLGDGYRGNGVAGLPVFMVLYIKDPITFHVYPLTDLAKKLYGEEVRVMSERDYGYFQLMLRHPHLRGNDENKLAEMGTRLSSEPIREVEQC